MKSLVNLSLSVLFFLVSASTFADLGDVEDFSDGGSPDLGEGLICSECVFNGWSIGAGGIVLDGGEDDSGDHALAYDSAGFGFHLLTWNFYSTATNHFFGDYIAGNVSGIRFRARHSGIGDTLVLRAYLFRIDEFGIGGIWTNASVTIPASANTWQDYVIPFAIGDFNGPVPGAGTDPVDGITVSDVLQHVDQLGLRHDPDGSGPRTKDWTSTLAYFDDIRLVSVDSDGDGVYDLIDNCPTMANPDQTDDNGDGFGDLCVDPSVDIPDDSEVHPSTVIGMDTSISTGVVIEENVVLGEDVSAKKNASIGADTTIDNNTVLNQGVVVGSGVVIGQNTVIGKDVVIEDRVSIGDDTSIGRGSYLCADALIGNDVTIGKNNLVDTEEEVLDNVTLAGMMSAPGPCSPPPPP